MMEDFSFGVVPILKSTGEVLLVESTDHEWSLPKGHKEIRDGTDEECALRELAEETGITQCQLVADKRYEISYTVTKDGSEYKKTVCFFPGFVEAPETVPAPGEILNTAWCTYAEAQAQTSFEDVRIVIEKTYTELGLLR